MTCQKLPFTESDRISFGRRKNAARNMFTFLAAEMVVPGELIFAEFAPHSFVLLRLLHQGKEMPVELP